MTGSELAGHRLLESVVAPCCGTALPHGGMAQVTLKRFHRLALRLPRPSGAAAAGRPGRRDRHPLGLFWGGRSLHCGANRRQPLRREATPSKRGRPRSRTPGRTRETLCSTTGKESRPSAGHVTITSGEILSGPSHSPGRTRPPSRHAVFLHGSRRNVSRRCAKDLGHFLGGIKFQFVIINRHGHTV